MTYTSTTDLLVIEWAHTVHVNDKLTSQINLEHDKLGSQKNLKNHTNFHAL